MAISGYASDISPVGGIYLQIVFPATFDVEMVHAVSLARAYGAVTGAGAGLLWPAEARRATVTALPSFSWSPQCADSRSHAAETSRLANGPLVQTGLSASGVGT